MPMLFLESSFKRPFICKKRDEDLWKVKSLLFPLLSTRALRKEALFLKRAAAVFAETAFLWILNTSPSPGLLWKGRNAPPVTL